MHVLLPNARQSIRWGVGAYDLSTVVEVRDKQNCTIRYWRVITEGKRQTMRKHQRTEPPGRPAQPAPPHVPHSASQQMPFRSTPSNPLLQIVSVGVSRGAGVQNESANAESQHKTTRSTSSCGIITPTFMSKFSSSSCHSIAYVIDDCCSHKR